MQSQLKQANREAHEDSYYVVKATYDINTSYKSLWYSINVTLPTWVLAPPFIHVKYVLLIPLM